MYLQNVEDVCERGAGSGEQGAEQGAEQGDGDLLGYAEGTHSQAQRIV